MSADATLFQSRDVLVRHRPAGTAPGALCCITFSSFTTDPSLARQGFAEEFLLEAGIDAIHVLTRDNLWYQYPEMPAVLRAVAAVARGYARRVTYGSSMGGYAALRFAEALGAQTAIVLSPQFSVDPRQAPFETRWRADVKRIRFNEAPLRPPARMVIFYDPHQAEDAAHVARIAACGSALLVPLPYGGHPVGPLLVETGQLRPAILDILADRFDPVALQRAVRARRRDSRHYLYHLAQRARGRPLETRIALLRRAVAIAPESHILSTLARLLDQRGAHAEAGPLHREALRLVPSNPRARIAHAHHLEALGQPAAAAAELRLARQGLSGSSLRLVRQAQLRLALRRWHCAWLLRLAGRLNTLLPERLRHRPSL